jgi:hypothetical protein
MALAARMFWSNAYAIRLEKRYLINEISGLHAALFSERFALRTRGPQLFVGSPPQFAVICGRYRC